MAFLRKRRAYQSPFCQVTDEESQPQHLSEHPLATEPLPYPTKIAVVSSSQRCRRRRCFSLSLES